MKVLAFLQNMWLRDPESFKATMRGLASRYNDTMAEQYRLRCIHRFLFAGCLSGRRLEDAFGAACHLIIWEESTREIADNPRTVFPADVAHMRAAIEKHQPDVVIAFGKIAADAVRHLWPGNFLIVAPHPAARDGLTPARLREAAKALELMRASLAELKQLEAAGG